MDDGRGEGWRWSGVGGRRPSGCPIGRPTKRRPRLWLLVLLTAIALGPQRPAGAKGEPSPPSPAVRSPTPATADTAAATACAAAYDGTPFTSCPRALLGAAEKLKDELGGSVIVLREDVHVSFDERGQETFDFVRVFKVLTDGAAEEWGQLGYSFDPWYQDQPTLRARVVAADGASHDLDPKTIEIAGQPSSDGSLYSDRRTVRAPLPGIKAGAVVEERVTVHDHAPFFAGGTQERIYLPDVLTQSWRLVIDAPKTLPLNVHPQGLPAAGVRAEAGDRVRWTFQAAPVAAQPLSESDLPGDEPSPGVGFSTGQSWRDVARRYSAEVEAKLRGVDLGPLAAPLSGAAAGPQKTATALLERIVREVRYTGVELGEASLIPTSPTEVLRRKFGDCKDQALLLVALLRRFGLDARVALLRAGVGEDIDATLPGLGRFNHAIVHVKGKAPFWIDPTDGFAAAGSLPVGDQDRWALVIGDDTAAPVKTPRSRPADNLLLEAFDLALPTYGNARVVEVDEGKGIFDASLRASYAGRSDEEARQAAARYVKQSLFAKDLTSLHVDDPRALGRPFQIRYEAHDSEIGTARETDATVFLSSLFFEDEIPAFLREPPASKKKPEDDHVPGRPPRPPRTRDYVIARPFVQERTMVVHPPAGFTPRPLPLDLTLALGPASLARHTARGPGDVVTSKLRFDIGKARWTPAEAESFREALTKLRETESFGKLLFVSAGEEAMAQGHFADGLASFRAAVAAQPASGRARSQLAKALLRAGFGRAAREEARRATEMEPDSAYVFTVLGEILTCDELGQPYAPGFDFAGAERALRHALQLGPKEIRPRTALAFLLEHDDAGERLSPRAKLAEAVALYQALGEEKSTEVDSDAARERGALIETFRNHPREAEQIARRLPRTTAREQIILTAVFLQHGLGRLLAELPVFAEGAEAQAQLLFGVSADLIALRRYADVLAVAEEGARRGGKLEPSLRNRAYTARQVLDLDRALKLRDDPASVVRRLMLAAGAPPSDPRAPLRELLGGELKEGDVGQVLFDSMRQTMGGIARTNGLALQVLAEVTAATAPLRADPDGAGGFRVHVGDKQDATPAGWFFLAPENKRMVIVAHNESLAMYGRAVQARLDAGAAEVAYRWLDWATEFFTRGDGGDPLGDPPFLRVWVRGTRDAALARIAAAVLVATDDPTRRSHTVLRDCITAHPAGTPVAAACAVALAAGARPAIPPTEAASLARDLLKAFPDSRRAASALANAEIANHKPRDAVMSLADLVRRQPQDRRAVLILAQAQQVAGDLTGAVKTLSDLTRIGQLDAEELNQLAWSRYVAGRDLKQALDEAQQSVALSGRKSRATLNTLASIQAELGRADDARATIFESLALGYGQPLECDWLVFGRIGEWYGLAEEARRAYGRLGKPKEEIEIPSSCWQLTQQRLALLDAKAKKSPASAPTSSAAPAR